MKKALIFFLFGISSITACKRSDEQTPQRKAVVAGYPQNSTPAANLTAMGRKAGNTAAVYKTPGETIRAELNNMYTREKPASTLKEQRNAMLRYGKQQRGFYPEGSERKLTSQDIQYLTPWGKKIMLSEIYARHGMTFRDEALNRHFSGQSWYKPKGEYIFQELTPVEKQNITFLINILPEEGFATAE